MGQSCSISLGSSGAKDGGVFRSDDHGVTWQQKNFVRVSKKTTVSLNDATGRVLIFNPNDHQQLYLGTLANGIWTTTDAGEHWQSTSLRSGGYECLVFDPLNPKIMYTAAGQNVLKSVDSGLTWTAVYTESQPGHAMTCVTVNPTDGREIWATTNGGKILMSDDYGKRWTLMQTLTPFIPRRLYIPTDAPGQLYIITRTTGVWRGDSHGQSWTDISSPLSTFAGGNDIRQIDIQRNGWYLATAFGLLRSTDRGGHWASTPTLVTNGSVALQNVAVNPNNSLEIFITTDQRLHHTTNGGTSWSVTTLPTGRLPVLLTFDPSQTDRLYFTTYKQPKK